MFSCLLLLLIVGITELPEWTLTTPAIVTFVIDENLPVGSEVGKISLDVSPTDQRDEPTTGTTFTLQDTSYFDFDPHQPNSLVVKSPLDRDTDRKLCSEGGWPEVCSWSGVIFSSDGRLLSLRIVVRDVNDNTPSWLTSQQHDGLAQLQISVTENCPLGTAIDLPLASDPDVGSNSVVNYERVIQEAVDHRAPFDIISTREPNGVRYKLVVRGKLDRETTPLYRLMIAAVDGGGNRGLAQLTILIADENDNRPVFTHTKMEESQSDLGEQQTEFTITIDEDLPVGSRLPRYPVATDADEGDFGRITYSFAISVAEVVKRDFRIDEVTGAIFVRAPLDYDTGGLTHYQFVIVAQDHGIPPLTASSKVIIEVQDRNDNAPIITVTPTTTATMTSSKSNEKHEKTSLHLLENAPSGSLIATITVHDPDSGENGKFMCQLGKVDSLRLEFLKNLGKLSVYQLYSSLPLDRESNPEIRVTLRCRDHGVPGRVSTELLMVNISDVNDNAPMFVNHRYSFQTSEGNDQDELIGLVTAVDSDSGVNAELSYSIIWPNNQGLNPFIINARGEIRARMTLDRESRPEGFQFTVLAKDHGVPSLSALAKVEVALIDVNDCSPTFTQGVYHFTVEEEIPFNLSNAYVIGQVKATDCDIGNNAQILYQLETTDAPFQISSDGYLSTTRPIDREQSSSFVITIQAIDSPQTTERRLSSFAEVQITVVDINDNDPIFLRPPFENGTHQVTLSIYEDINCKVVKIEAIDKDIERNGEIRFRLANDVSRGMFALNPESGELTLKRRLTVEEVGIIPLRILAIDNGLKPRTATTTIEILAADVPATKPTSFSGNLDYSEQPNTFLGNLRVNANKFIIVCIVVITLIICLILAAVICVVSRKGCAAWTGAPTTSMRNQKQIHLVSHSNGTLPLTEPPFSTSPDMEAFITKETPSIGYSEPSKYFSNAYQFHDQWDTAISQDGRIRDNPLANPNASEFYAGTISDTSNMFQSMDNGSYIPSVTAYSVLSHGNAAPTFTYGSPYLNNGSQKYPGDQKPTLAYSGSGLEQTMESYTFSPLDRMDWGLQQPGSVGSTNFGMLSTYLPYVRQQTSDRQLLNGRHYGNLSS
ncbi:hypothetical protein CRM22_009656 [Opisthorchis felineus]|uniref:Cadherin domain-containing protein n=1 Tax=Opisthorchis felineus TaxID=147828 RepID=A0A4V3SCX5_OPIFE|nr:hypothetical protein CRM22_009656 [Opisthorchis felineus]